MVRILDLTDNPDRFRVGARFWLGEQTVVIAGVKRDGEQLLAKFEGYLDRDLAEPLRGHWLEIEESQRRTLESDEFWPDQLEGLSVVTETGQRGKVTGVIEGQRQDRLQIEMDGQVVELPFVKELVPEIDLDQNLIRVNPPEGKRD